MNSHRKAPNWRRAFLLLLVSTNVVRLQGCATKLQSPYKVYFCSMESTLVSEIRVNYGGALWNIPPIPAPGQGGGERCLSGYAISTMEMLPEGMTLEWVLGGRRLKAAIPIKSRLNGIYPTTGIQAVFQGGHVELFEYVYPSNNYLMRLRIYPPEVKWWNWKALIPSALIGVVAYGLVMGQAEQIKPPDGYVFERLPVISGIYRLPRSSSRYSTSWVGPNVIQCGGVGYYVFDYSNCGRREALDGREVEVLQVIMPTSHGPSPYVMQISVDGQKYYEKSDAQLRELWISGTSSGAFNVGWIVFLVVHTAQLIYLDRRLNKIKAEPT